MVLAKKIARARDRWLDLCDEHPRLDSAVRYVRRLLPPLNFITIHYAYFLAATGLSSVIFWASSDPLHSVSYVDSLFIVTSSITNTGLNTFNLSQVTLWQQILLWLLLILGSNIWISFWTVMFRRRAFEHRFEDIVETEREMRRKLTAERRSGPSLARTLTMRSGTSTGGGLSLPHPFRRKTAVSTLSDVPGEPTGLSTISEKIKETDFAPKPIVTAPSSSDESSATGVDNALSPVSVAPDHISFVNAPAPHHQNQGHSSAYEPGHRLPPRARPDSLQASTIASNESDDFLFHWKRILTKHNVSRKGQFYDLTSEERERLGGTEYRALKILSVVVPLYAFLWQFLGAMALGAWFHYHVRDPEVRNGANAWWTGVFYGVSAFNNSGLSLVDDSLVPFIGHYFVLIVAGLLILAGNTAYPIFLRLILWTSLKVLQAVAPQTHGPLKETLEFILKYPRRVYTTLFPSRATWWLVAVLVVTNVIDWLAFEILNLGNPAVEVLSIGERIIGGLFQAISVRAAGFVIISISTVYIGLQTLYFVMMYISVYPVVITMRNSNVYEERSIGIYEDDPSAIQRYEAEEAAELTTATDTQEPSRRQFLKRRGTGAKLGRALGNKITFNGVGAVPKKNGSEEPSPVSFVGQQIRAQLAHDLWWLILAIIVIVIIETDHFLDDPVTHSVFNVLFESVSAYGCVGLSVGLPTQSFSFSGSMHTGSKLVMIAVMLRGRHRGLPVAVDRAVRLPGEKLQKEEEDDSNIRRTKTIFMQNLNAEV